MPNVYIGEGPFGVLSAEYGHDGAKEKLRELAKEHAKEVQAGE